MFVDLIETKPADYLDEKEVDTQDWLSKIIQKQKSSTGFNLDPSSLRKFV